MCHAAGPGDTSFSCWPVWASVHPQLVDGGDEKLSLLRLMQYVRCMAMLSDPTAAHVAA